MTDFENMTDGLRPEQKEIVKRELGSARAFAQDWVAFYRSRGDGVQLDGDFTIEELEELVRVMKLLWPSRCNFGTA